jgi:predicted enzyme related to lactoylglutathione lyase
MIHPTYGNGKICYIEVPAEDIQASASFYQKIFGWKIRNRNDGSVAFDDGVREVSGTFVADREPHVANGLVVHLMVDDMHATLQLITANGGAVVQSAGMDPGEVTARFRDPAGNVFGLYQHGG